MTDSAVSEMGQLAGLLTQQSLLINQLLTEIKTGKESRAQEVQEREASMERSDTDTNIRNHELYKRLLFVCSISVEPRLS